MDRFILYPLFLASLAVIGFLAWQLFEYATALPTWESALTRTTASLNAANREISSLEQTSAQLRADVAAVTAAQQSTAQELKIHRNALAEANDNISQANATITERNSQLHAVRNEIDTAQASLRTVQAELSVQKLATRGLEQLVRERDGTITTLRGQVQSKDGRIAQLSSQITRQSTQISQQNTTISNLQTSLRQARSQQVKIPTCSTNYYTAIGGQLSCVNRNTAAFQATQVETRPINLPQTGRVTLKINRSGELGSDRSMEILEHSVRTIEEYMGQPMPLQGREIRLDFVKAITSGGDPAGIHKGTHIEILQEYDSAEPQPSSNWWGNIRGIQSSSADYLPGIIAHEVAHYYWTDERTWLHEGAAEFLDLHSESERTGDPIQAQRQRCAEASNISRLEAKRYESGDDGFICNYSLGEGLFVDLYNAMSATQFRQSFRELYDSGKNKLAGIHQVRQAYPGSWAIIDRWYGYREMPEAHWLNGNFLGYTTWQEGGEWRVYTRNNRPCATILRMNDNPTRYEPWLRAMRDDCYYTGVWSAEGDLLVTIDGTTYRAVEVATAPPRYGSAGSVHPVNSISSPTAIPLRGQL